LAAEQGHKDAQYNLGMKLLEGRGVRKDASEASHWFRQSAAQGDGWAMNNLGHLYQKGYGKVERDGREALRWYLHAIEHGEVERAPHNIARIYEEGIDVPKDLTTAYLWRRLAHPGSEKAIEECAAHLIEKMTESQIQEGKRLSEAWPPARLALCATTFPGKRTSTGRGLLSPPSCGEITPANGLSSLEARASSGDTASQCWLGYAYYYGVGVEKNHENALHWYALSAEQGNAIAQWGLGNLYEYGRGVEEDIEKALDWYKKAAEQGLSEAEAKVGHYLAIAEEHEEAARWNQKAAQKGDLMARANLARMYADGRGVPRDHVAAYAWFSSIKNDVCAFDLESWRAYESSTDIFELVELGNREASKLSAEKKAEAERRGRVPMKGVEK
jgi:TPR repeat protein